jgi:hypothetical protein
MPSFIIPLLAFAQDGSVSFAVVAPIGSIGFILLRRKIPRH